jgi:hypothetical protein
VYDVGPVIHPASELRYVNPSIGYGVFATRFIPRGTITWVFDDLDQVVAAERTAVLLPAMREALDKYSYLNGRGERILCWDHARFVNHSCHPTSLAPGFDLEIAIRDIQEGEEITDDYGSLNLEMEFACACGSEQCRGTIRPGDFDRYGARWDSLVAEAFPLISRVEQPLWDLVAEKTEIMKVLAGEVELPSCRMHFLGAASSTTNAPA